MRTTTRLKGYASFLGRARDALRRRKRNRTKMQHLDFELFQMDIRV